MNSKEISNGILKALAIIIGIALLLYFLYAIQSVIVYIIIAAILSLIARPLIGFLKKRLKFPNTLSVITAMIILVSFLLGIIVMFVPLIIKQGESLSLLQTDKLEQNLQSVLNQVNTYFLSKNINLLSELKNVDMGSAHLELANHARRLFDD